MNTEEQKKREEKKKAEELAAWEKMERIKNGPPCSHTWCQNPGWLKEIYKCHWDPSLKTNTVREFMTKNYPRHARAHDLQPMAGCHKYFCEDHISWIPDN